MTVMIRDGSKFIWYPGPDHRQGAKTFFRKKIWGTVFFSKKIRWAKTFFTIKFENPRFHFSMLGSSDSSVLRVSGYQGLMLLAC